MPTTALLLVYQGRQRDLRSPIDNLFRRENAGPGRAVPPKYLHGDTSSVSEDTP